MKKGFKKITSRHKISAKDYYRIDIKDVVEKIKNILNLVKESEIKDKEYYLRLGNSLTELMIAIGFETIIDNDIEKEPIISLIKSKADYVEELFKEGNQFDFISEKSKDRTLEDILANVMYLSNQLAHRFEENFNNNHLVQKIDNRPISNYFFDIKMKCLDELLRLNKLGKPILIRNFIDNRAKLSFENVYAIVLPGYLEAFSVHGEQRDNYSFDTSSDLERFTKRRVTMIPFHINSEDCKKIKQKYEEESVHNEENGIKLFLKIQDKFQKEENKNKNKNKKTNNEIFFINDSIIDSINNKDIRNLQDIIQDEFNNRSPRKLLKPMFDLIDTFGFWEELIEYENNGIYNQLLKYDNNNSDIGLVDDVLITRRQIENQFNPEREQELPELFANLIILSDTIINLMWKNRDKLSIKEIEYRSIANTVTLVRNHFQNELIKCRNNKRGKILIREEEIDLNEKRKMLHAYIPGYMGLFSTILPKNNQREFLKYGNDQIPFYNEDDEKKMHTIFPIKATEKQEDIFKKISDNNEMTIPNKTQSIEDSDTNNNSVLRERNPKKVINQPKTMTPEKKRNNKQLNDEIKNSNREFLKGENERLNNIIPRAVIKGITERTSYLLKDLYEKKMKAIIQQELYKKGYSKEQLDSESSKVFLYMRMCKTLSTIRLLGKANPSLANIIKQSVDEYETAFQVMNEYFKTDRRSKTLSGFKKVVEKKLKEKSERANNNILKEGYIPYKVNGEISKDELVIMFQQFIEQLTKAKAELEELNKKLANRKKYLEYLKGAGKRQENAEKTVLKQDKKIANLDKKIAYLNQSRANEVEKKQELQKKFERLSEEANDAKTKIPGVESEIRELKEQSDILEVNLAKFKEIERLIKGDKSEK